MKKDKEGRITNLVNAQHISKGHSVCVSCGKDMPICWDTVCCVCGNTSCYDCSYSDDKFWYCDKHQPQIKIEDLDLPVIEITKDKFQEILDAEGYNMTVDKLMQERRKYQNSYTKHKEK